MVCHTQSGLSLARPIRNHGLSGSIRRQDLSRSVRHYNLSRRIRNHSDWNKKGPHRLPLSCQGCQVCSFSFSRLKFWEVPGQVWWLGECIRGMVCDYTVHIVIDIWGKAVSAMPITRMVAKGESNRACGVPNLRPHSYTTVPGSLVWQSERILNRSNGAPSHWPPLLCNKAYLFLRTERRTFFLHQRETVFYSQRSWNIFWKPYRHFT